MLNTVFVQTSRSSPASKPLRLPLLAQRDTLLARFRLLFPIHINFCQIPHVQLHHYFGTNCCVQLTSKLEVMAFSLEHCFAVILVCLTLVRQSNGGAIPVDGIIDHTDNALERRQCEWSNEDARYNCNFNLPSLLQIVARMNDASGGGRATPSARAVFHTNLIAPYGPVLMYDWIISWLFANGIAEWYSDYNAANNYWVQTQQDWIHRYPNDMQPKVPGWSPSAIFGGCFSQALAVAATVSPLCRTKVLH